MDDLGLSLTLATVSSSHHHHAANHPWADIFSPPPATTRSLAPTGIDVNCAPPVAAETADDDAGASSSPNSTVSSVSAGKRGLPTAESESDRAAACSDDDDAAAGEGSRKKLRLSKDQSAILEDSFKEHSTLNPKQKMALAKQLNLRPRQVEVWFQNRRARTKLKQTEVDCEFLKRCCENLTEENRRLQKEVQELRALKLSPQFYMHMTPPTTLTLCPSCERVSAPTTTTASSSHISVDRNRVGNGNGNIRQLSFFQQQHPAALPTPPPQQQQRQVALGNPVLPWAPMPLRAGTAFLDAQLQRS